MKFSIVTPVYNGLGKIERAVGSVRGQEGVELEHLVQDAASPDGTAVWAENQSGLSVFSEPDSGMYDAINKGWARSTGDILSWLNVDEQYLPGTLARVQKEFEAYPEADFVFGNSIFTNPEGDAIAARREIPLRNVYVKNGFLYALSCTLFFRRRLIGDGRLTFDPAFKNAGDADLVLRLLRDGHICRHIPAYLSLFGVDNDNLTVSLGDNMARETGQLRKTYGGAPLRFLQHLIMGGRYVERFLRGCYRKENLVYRYAINEAPEYVTKTCSGVGSRFTFKRAMRKLAASSKSPSAECES